MYEALAAAGAILRTCDATDALKEAEDGVHETDALKGTEAVKKAVRGKAQMLLKRHRCC